MRRRGPAAALGATGGFSFLFGPLFLMSILLYRDYFYRSSVSMAEGHLGALVVLGDRLRLRGADHPAGDQAAVQAGLDHAAAGRSAVVTVALGETFIQPAYLAIGFCLYLTRQGVAICAVTILQEEVADAYRGRVFAFYDMMFNVTYVAGAALSAAIMPADGHSPGLIALVAAGFAVVAAAYWLAAAGSVLVRAAPGTGIPPRRPSAAAPEWPAPGPARPP